MARGKPAGRGGEQTGLQAQIARIRAGTIAPCYVFHGDEPAPIRDIIAELRRAVLAPGGEAFDHERLLGRDLPHVGVVIQSCAQLPMISSRRLVVLEEPELLAVKTRGAQDEGQGGEGEDSGSGGPLARAKARVYGALTAYVEAPSPSTVLVVVAPGLTARSKLVAAVKKHGGVAESFGKPRFDRDAATFVRARAEQAGYRLGRGVAEQIVQAVGTGFSEVMSALDRAALHAGKGQPISQADVEAVVTQTREADIFDLVDAVGLGQRDRALALLSRRFATRAMPDLAQTHLLLHMLVRQIRLLYTAHCHPRDVETVTGAKPFVAKKLSEQARRFDDRRLRAALGGLAQIDRELKGASDLARHRPRERLERWVFEICGGIPGAAPGP